MLTSPEHLEAAVVASSAVAEPSVVVAVVAPVAVVAAVAEPA